MTKSRLDADEGENRARCRWCRRVIIRQPGPGRPKQFCSQRCRQWDWVSRQRAADLALGIDEIVIDRNELDRLHDDLYVLACAVEDVERDVLSQAEPAAREVAEALDWIVSAARPLMDREVSAPGTPPVDSS